MRPLAQNPMQLPPPPTKLPLSAFVRGDVSPHALSAPECSVYYPELDNTPGTIINPKRKTKNGFTLIELSIVLVIIGLIVGGVLVGRDLISSAEVRAQITQIEKFNTAVNTFYGKYGYLPGDIPNPYATQFGFVSRPGGAGRGDGNGVLQGYSGGVAFGWIDGAGETVMFWVDLSMAGLIESSFSTANPTTTASNDVAGTGIDQYLPQAKIGRGNYVYVWNTNYNINTYNNNYPDNYYGISAVTSIASNSNYGRIISNANIPVKQAYAIDAKMDDGLPLSRRVLTLGLSTDVMWANNTTFIGTGGGDALHTASPPNNAVSATATTCYDNAGNSVNTMTYSLSQNGGNGANCALSFRFQ